MRDAEKIILDSLWIKKLYEIMLRLKSYGCNQKPARSLYWFLVCPVPLRSDYTDINIAPSVTIIFFRNEVPCVQSSFAISSVSLPLISDQLSHNLTIYIFLQFSSVAIGGKFYKLSQPFH